MRGSGSAVAGAKSNFSDKYAFAGAMADKIVIEDRATGQQEPLFRIIGNYKLIELKRNESCIVFSAKGEMISLSNSMRYRPADKPGGMHSPDLPAGKTEQKIIPEIPL